MQKLQLFAHDGETHFNRYEFFGALREVALCTSNSIAFYARDKQDYGYVERTPQGAVAYFVTDDATDDLVRVHFAQHYYNDDDCVAKATHAVLCQMFYDNCDGANIPRSFD